MIEITEYDNAVIVSGHAGYAPPGQDIVCSAVSALTQTLIASLIELTDCKIKSDLRQGNVVIEYTDLTEDAQILLKSFFIGVEGVAFAYPENVKISRKARPSVEVDKS